MDLYKEADFLEQMYSDVCGPMRDKSLGGASYFVTFIDDASRKVWAFALKSKDQVYPIFVDFHKVVERDIGKKLKSIRTDNRDEYIGEFSFTSIVLHRGSAISS